MNESKRPKKRTPPAAARSTSERPLHDYVREVCESDDVRVGLPLPMGTYAHGDGTNFSLFSRHATRVRLELYEHPEDAKAARSIDLDPVRNRTGDMWHVWVKGIRAGQLYAYRIDGPYRPEDGHRFDFRKLLLDPFATAISMLPNWEFDPPLGHDAGVRDEDSRSTVDNAGAMPKCVCTEDYFDWRGDRPLKHEWSETVIYETHVRGLTIHPSSGAQHPGTYRGVMEKIAYFKELGVTAIELMPVQEFNDQQVIGVNPHGALPLRKYWGYDPVVFRAPKASYVPWIGEFRQVGPIQHHLVHLFDHLSCLVVILVRHRYFHRWMSMPSSICLHKQEARCRDNALGEYNCLSIVHLGTIPADNLAVMVREHYW
jgi:glycogen operon protein